MGWNSLTMALNLMNAKQKRMIIKPRMASLSRWTIPETGIYRHYCVAMWKIIRRRRKIHGHPPRNNVINKNATFLGEHDPCVRDHRRRWFCSSDKKSISSGGNKQKPPSISHTEHAEENSLSTFLAINLIILWLFICTQTRPPPGDDGGQDEEHAKSDH